MDSLLSRMHHLIAPVSVSVDFPRGLSKWDRLCFEGKKSGKEKGEGNTSLITTRGRRGFLRFLRIVKPSEVKAVCLTRLIDFTVLKPGWKFVILCIVLPFLLITIDSCMIDLYHYVQRRDLYYSNDCTILFDLIMIVIYICPIVTDYTINLIIICLTIRLICSTAWLTLANLYYLSNDDCYLCFDKSCSFLLDNKTRQKKFFLIISAIPLIGF